MRDNDEMKSQEPESHTIEDQNAADALTMSDPADAPDIADGIAAGLQRELDQTGTPQREAEESNS